MTITTKFTETFGVEHPIAQGGMQWVGRARNRQRKHQDRGHRGTVMGLIDDIPTCGKLVSRIVGEADELITGRLSGMVTPSKAAVSV